VRGLVLTVYRLARCHPWGGHGYDPPRWYGEPEASEEVPSPGSRS
jgi:putative component of membrane protein insertase Oxa1/YidC/SpoIIIJ protein YidD